MAKKEDLKNFSIKSYLEYTKKDIKETIQKKPINYLNIIESSKKNQKDRFEEISKNLNRFILNKFIDEKEKSLYVYHYKKISAKLFRKL